MIFIRTFKCHLLSLTIFINIDSCPKISKQQWKLSAIKLAYKKKEENGNRRKHKFKVKCFNGNRFSITSIILVTFKKTSIHGPFQASL